MKVRYLTTVHCKVPDFIKAVGRQGRFVPKLWLRLPTAGGTS